MKTSYKWILGGVLVLFVLLQLTNPVRTNPPVLPGHDLMATNPPPAAIASLLQGACYDCHSDQTRWPWYAHVAPVSWLIADDVKEGRRHLNFSNWPHGDPAHAARLWEHVGKELSYDEMPPAQYKLMHSAARFSAAQRQELIHWAQQESKRLQAGVAAAK